MLGGLFSKDQADAAKSLGAELKALLVRSVEAQERQALATERVASLFANINDMLHRQLSKKGGKS